MVFRNGVSLQIRACPDRTGTFAAVPAATRRSGNPETPELPHPAPPDSPSSEASEFRSTSVASQTACQKKTAHGFRQQRQEQPAGSHWVGSATTRASTAQARAQ